MQAARITLQQARQASPDPSSQLWLLTRLGEVASLRGDVTHRAEEARFELRLRGQAAKALALAQANYQVQREPRDARILLEAAMAARQPASAQPALDWLRRSGFEDARLRSLAKDLTGSAP